ncbi:MAG TPA: site-specific integrase, partial [Acidimicrobiales bacterium]
MSRAASIESLVERYIDERTNLRQLVKGSARNHRCTLMSFTQSLDGKAVRQLTDVDVETWLSARHKLAAATRRHNLSTVRSFCDWLVRRGYLRTNPTVELAPVKVPRYLPRALPAPKVAKLLEAAPDRRGVLMCLLMVQEGLRCAEVSGVQVGDID